MPITYYEFEVTCNPETRDLLIAELAEINFEGFVETDEGFSAFVPVQDLDQKSYEELMERYSMGSGSVKRKVVEQQNWNAEWEKSFEPIVVSDRVIIRAPFHSKDEKYAHEIVIQPKNTFGTGHHETTQLVIQLMLDEQFDGKTVFDYGSGTGVLGIFACQSGAAFVDAIDIDEWCVDNIEENKQLNGISNMHFTKGNLESVPGEKKYQVILANINKNILLGSFQKLSGLMEEGGHLLISGFYESDLEDLKQEAIKYHLHLHKHLVKNEWCAAQFKFLVLAL